MANERPDYRALRSIPDPTNAGHTAYLEGEGLHEQVVRDWGLRIGEDVAALRPEQMAKPAGNAKRGEWAAYALAQGRDQDHVDGLSRDQLRAEFDEADTTTEAEGAQPTKGE